ncbi:unnamed protein product [Symbiodinium sp. CCMP2592]|nr:unnamed protein product [Symbiodinium sp. CCMP2592]
MAGTAKPPSSPTQGDQQPAPAGGRKRPAVDEDAERPLTLTTLLAALKENREEIVAQVREDMDTINNRMSTVELTVETHVNNTTKLLEAMTDRHCVMEQSVRKVDERQQSVLQRLELLEGKFAKANFSMSSTRTSENEGGNPRPALVVGGWDADQHHEETLSLVKKHLTELNINLDLSQAFVPGLRRGFALVPLIKLEGETEEEQRARVQEALRTIRAAKVVTGQRPEGGQRYFFAAMSQSPERRKRAQLAGKVKRLIIEEGGDVRHIDVEYGTANLWYNSIKVASGVTSAPEGASIEKSGWVHLGSLARQIGISEETAVQKWGELRKALHWNVGGLSAAKALEVILALRRQRIRPFCGTLVVFIQEIICDPGKQHLSLGELQAIFGKKAEEWRGNAILHTSNLRHSQGKLLPCSISCTLTSDELRLGAFSVHIPHHATLSTTEQILQQLYPHLQSHHRAIVGIDANETFETAQQRRQTKACTARGEMLLEWFEEAECHLPQQALEQPSHFPYNTTMEPRRLDYIFVKKLLCDPGEILAQRDIATSDHEPVSVPLTKIRAKNIEGDQRAAPWSSRILKAGNEVDAILDRDLNVGGDPVMQIQQVAVAISKPGKNKQPFEESAALREMRRQALQAPPGEDRRRLWKLARRVHKQEHRRWQQLAMQKVAELDWGMKKALTEQSRDHTWELYLTDDDNWKKALQDHFEKIFYKQKQVIVTATIRGIMHQLEIRCKHTPWKPFTMEELMAVKVKWRNGKSCGPDMVSHEALKAMLPHPRWGNRLLELFNDMLYTCRIVASVEAGVTILLAKTSQPKDWSETRPITLSSVLLKTFGQLILQRSGDAIQTPARLQWCRRGRQGVELILILRRLARIARDWGLEFYIAKLDIRKAFDSIYQESLAAHVYQTIGEKARLPWEARAWVALLHAENICIQVAGENIPIRQSNGVRQGAPESPVAFGSVVADDLDAAIQEARTSKPSDDTSPPEDGGSYMDDNYIWSTNRQHFQHLLSCLGHRLPRRGLYLHPGKTDIISNSDKQVTFKVAGENVTTKGPKHIFHGGPPCYWLKHRAEPARPFGGEVVTQMCNMLAAEYRRLQTAGDKARLRAWKDRMQSSIRQSHKWVKDECKRSSMLMRTSEGSFTVDRNEQLDHMLTAWKPIFEKFHSRPADCDRFIEQFGPYMRSARMDLEPLSGPFLAEVARETASSAPSLDMWKPGSLAALGHWAPGIYDDLALILDFVETTSRWPRAILRAYTALIPKDSTVADPAPTEFRPITVLSGIYRLWSKARFVTAMKWQECWVDDSVFGCRRKRSSEQLAMQVALDLEASAYGGPPCVGGVSYDFKKAFDLVPINIMLATMRRRGAAERLLRPLASMYDGLWRVFRLRGALGEWWRPDGGIIQGDALSMIALNSIVSCVLEASKVELGANVKPRSYADDISVVAQADTVEGVSHGLRGFHAIIRAYEQAECGEVHERKTYTFGDAGIEAAFEPAYSHLSEFRLVGGSIVVRDAALNVTMLEQKRWDAWKGSIRRIRHVPRSWADRSRMMMATQSQALFGQGTHAIAADVTYLRTVRTEVMRSLWGCEFYSMSPLVTMAILCPVQLDPEFGAAYEGLRTVMRIMRVPDIAAEIRRRYHCTPSAVVDGPTLRLQNLRDVSILSTRVNELMAGEIDEGLWLHQLRDEWRAYLWRKVSQERSQHYAGAGRVDRVRTLLYHRKLEERARQGDEDAWAKLGVLRRIIAGGLMTPERASRHKRQDSNRMCSCGAEEETIMHVSWRCALYAEERAHVLESLGCRIEDLSICFTYAMVVPEDFYLNDDVVLVVQEFLVDVWQKHIVRWHAGGDLEDKRRNFPTREITERGIVENGHLLAPRTEGGFWCRLCGKFTSNTQHVRLKITSKPCTQRGGPVLASEGFLSNDNRLDQLERELNMKYNRAKHLLHWNRKLGKNIGAPDEGWLQCLRCGRKWRWKDRTSNLPRTLCSMWRAAKAKFRITKKTALSKLPRTRYFSERADANLSFDDVPHLDPPRAMQLVQNTNLLDPQGFLHFGSYHPAEIANPRRAGQTKCPLGMPDMEWATWNKRSLRRSRLALYHCGGTRWSTFVLSQICTAIGHVSRGDPVGGKILQWHSLQWWQEQKDIGRPLQHAARFNAYMDIDRQLSDTIGKNWFAIAQDRDTWGEWEATFIAKYDVPWSSGKQSSISNLAPGDQQASDKAFLESLEDRGNMITHLAECALADLLVDDQTESEVLRQLELEHPSVPSDAGEPDPKRARTGATTASSTQQALQRILTKAWKHLSAASNHNPVSYHDIQHDIDILLTWLNSHLHAMATARGGHLQQWGSDEADLNYDRGMFNTGNVLGQLGTALQGIQMEPQQREHWLLLADVSHYLAAVERGDPVGHPADVIADSYRSGRVENSILSTAHSCKPLKWWKKHYTLDYQYFREPLKCTILPGDMNYILDTLHSRELLKCTILPGDMRKLWAKCTPPETGGCPPPLLMWTGGSMTGTMALEMLPGEPLEKNGVQQKTYQVGVKKVPLNIGAAAYMEPTMIVMAPSESL